MFLFTAIQIQKVQRKRSEKKRAASTEITRDTPIQATSWKCWQIDIIDIFQKILERLYYWTVGWSDKFVH